MDTMSSRCQEEVESSPYPCEERDAVCSLEHAFQATTIKDPDPETEDFPRRPLRRRRFRLAQAIRRQVPLEVLHQDLCPLRERHPLSHRKARLAPSSSKAQGLPPGGPPTSLRSRGRRLGTTWRRVSKHVSLKKEKGKEGQTLGSSSARPFRNYRSQES